MKISCKTTIKHDSALIILIGLFCFLFFGVSKTYALTPETDYLWIGLGESVKEKDGSISLPVEVNYGRFPEEKKDLSELENLKAFYSQGKKNNDNDWIFHETQMEKNNGRYHININSPEQNRFIIIIEAKKTQGELKYHYSAKASFFLFGHSFSDKKQMKPVSFVNPEHLFEISTEPQFDYWPQVENPIKITPSFDKEHLPGSPIYLFDENKTQMEIKTDQKGTCTYEPPNDKKLNWQGDRAFKQTLIATEKFDRNAKYIATYTLLLHRSRSKNRKIFPGAAIFAGIVIGFSFIMVLKRRNFKI